MEMQQMLELLLASQKNAEANRVSDREQMLHTRDDKFKAKRGYNLQK
jgi:hypothetical protein